MGGCFSCGMGQVEGFRRLVLKNMRGRGGGGRVVVSCLVKHVRQTGRAFIGQMVKPQPGCLSRILARLLCPGRVVQLRKANHVFIG